MSIGIGGAQSFHLKTSFSSAPREPALPPMKIRSPRGPDSPPKKLAKNTSNSSTHTTFEGDGNSVLAQTSPSPRVDFSSLLDEQLSAAMSARELDAVATALRYRSPRPAAAVPPALVSPPSSASPRPLRTARTRGAGIQRPMSPEWTSEWLDEPVTLLPPLPPARPTLAAGSRLPQASCAAAPAALRRAGCVDQYSTLHGGRGVPSTNARYHVEIPFPLGLDSAQGCGRFIVH